MTVVEELRLPELFFGMKLHVLILFGILTMAFWMKVAPMATAEINREVAENVVSVFRVGIPDRVKRVMNASSMKNQVIDYIRGMIREQETNPDPVRQIVNGTLLSWNLTIMAGMGILVIVSMFDAYLLGGFRMLQAGIALMDNLLTFVVVGIVEYLFFTLIASKYVPVVPSAIREAAIQTLGGGDSRKK